MFRTMLMLVALSLSAVPCFAQTWGTVQYQTIIIDGQTTPRFVVTANLPITKGFSWSLYAQTDRNWSEAYAGPAYAPTAWSQVGVQIGTEAYTKVSRKAGFVWLGVKHVSVLALVEDGGSGRFTAMNASLNEGAVTTGYVYDSILGHGAKASVKVAKTYTLWASAQEHGAKLTLQYGF